ncbi:hypothetical protein [Neorhizobium galegae]|uniref:hypothetical protein n=1 Tax=Neorhizobium galegae TaxID=399 RepID=UPI000622AA6F|nr:hypothetical protein [Neorhizobium galegae]CDZ49387.1 Hypothetical protein NGAL_HAMBI2427_31410 [Neorhizobium galegae bv. orientalis]
MEQGEEFEHNDEILPLNERLAALDKAIIRAQKLQEREANERTTLQAREQTSYKVAAVRTA